MSSSTSSRPPALAVQRSTLPLHRVRFFDRTPSPITALAFAPTPLPPAHDPSVSAKGKGRLDRVQNGAAGGGSGNGPASQIGTPELGVLVLARDSGDVEVWGWVEPEGEGQGNWVLEKVLPPTLTHPGVSLMCLVLRDPAEFQHKPYKVPRLADLRLYTAGSDSGDITERCLFTGRILQTYTIPSPPLWAMSVSPTHQYLCLATTSPTLHFLSITPSGLEPPPAHLLRSDALPSRTRTVSIAWGAPRAVKSDSDSSSRNDSHTPSQVSWEWRDTYLVTGNSDSSFRKFDLLPPDASRPGAGRVALSDRAVVEKQSKGARKNGKGTVVWGVAVLPDHTIVTADSLGTVSFWDGASMAQKQTFRAHKADAMCMTIAAGGRAVFTSGPDQRVCQFVRVDKAAGAGSGSAGEWALTTTKRAHAHDVRALACFPAYTPAPIGELEPSPSLAPVLASGGWDMSLILTPCGAPSSSSAAAPKVRNPLGRAQVLAPRVAKILFEESYPRKMSYLGGARGTSLISISRAARLVLGRKERSVGVWKVHSHEQGWDKLLDMDFRLRTALTCAVLSDDGRWMAVSDLYETKLFALRPASTGTGSLVPKRIKSFLPTLLASKALKHLELESRGTGSSALLFTPDSGKLILAFAMSGQVVVLELSGDREARGEEVSVAQVFKRDDAAVGQGGRVIVTKKEMQSAKAASAAKGAAGTGVVANGNLPRAERRRLAREQQQQQQQQQEEAVTAPNGVAEEDMDVDGEDNDEKAAESNDSSSDSEDDSDGDSDAPTYVNDKRGRVACMAASADGQWLAVSDLLGKVSIFNLDTLRPHATLPTFPSSPITILSPPSHPSLFAILLPSQSLTFYDTESRTLLQPTAQLVKLNKALGDQFSAVSGATFEPAPLSSASPTFGDEGVFGALGMGDNMFGAAGLGSNASSAGTAKVDGKNVKLVVWSGDWVCSAKLDLDLVAKQSGKRRRGRGAAHAHVQGGQAQNGSAAVVADASKANGESSGVNGSSTTSLTGSAPVPRLSRKRRAREAREARDALERSSIASSPSASFNAGMANGTSAISSIPPSPLGSRLGISNTHANGDALSSASPAPGTAQTYQSSASDPDFYRFTHDAFRSLAAVDWLGSGEMMVVERPMGDFVQDLPGAFFVGTYGRG